MNLGLVQPQRLVSLAGLPGFDAWYFDPGKGLRIGAGCRLTDLADARHINDNYPALAKAIRARQDAQERVLLRHLNVDEDFKPPPAATIDAGTVAAA